MHILNDIELCANSLSRFSIASFSLSFCRALLHTALPFVVVVVVVVVVVASASASASACIAVTKLFPPLILSHQASLGISMLLHI